MREYPIGPVDRKRPMELDDGRPVMLADGGTISDYIPVTIGESNPGRAGHKTTCTDRFGNHYPERIWHFDPETGVLGGADSQCFCVLRNRDPSTIYYPRRRGRKLCL